MVAGLRSTVYLSFLLTVLELGDRCYVSGMSCPKLIPNGDFNPGCEALVGTSCPYTCHDGFKQTYNVTSCTGETRWWPSAIWLCESVIWPMCPFLILNGGLEWSCSRRQGDVCNFTCHDRYSPTQSVMTCTAGGKWDASPNTVCQDIRCPEVIPNGMISPVSCTRKADRYCRAFTCNDRYIRNTNLYSFLCLKGGKWDTRNESFCLERCSDLLPNGMWSPSCDFRPRSYCSYLCLPGFWSTTRKLTVTCMPDGQWQRDHRYICVPKANRCPLKLPNGRFEDGCKPDIGSSCSYECDHQYVKHESVSQPICLAIGNWSVDVYTMCAYTTVMCPFLILNGDLELSCSRRHGAVCNFTCHDRYSPTQSVMTCMADGKWDASPNTVCQDPRYVCPSYVRRGHIRVDCSRVVGNVCTYDCYPGYQRNPFVDEVECLSSQTWRNSDLLCGANLCPLMLRNGRFEDGCKPDIGSSCSYECDRQYVKHDSVSQPMCLATGNWSVNVYTMCVLYSSTDPCCETGSSMVGLISCAVVVMFFIIIMIVACRIRKYRRRTRNRNSREPNFVAVFVVNGGSRSVENTVTLSRPPDYREIPDHPAYALLDRSVAGGKPPEYESLHFEENDDDNPPPAYTPLAVQANDYHSQI